VLIGASFDTDIAASALIVTGDELLPPGSQPGGAKIVDSNSVVLRALVDRDGGQALPFEILPDEPAMPLPDEYRAMSGILTGVLDDLGRLYESLERHMDDAAWVTSRFVEILPLDLEQKQECLESSDPAARLQLIQEVLDSSVS